jgi:hypothetical protein
MPLLTQGKTNWKFLLIVVVLAVIVGGGLLEYVCFLWPKQSVPFSDSVKVEVPEKIKNETPKLKYEIEYPDLENFEGKGDYYYWFLSGEPKVEIYSPSEFVECSKEQKGSATPLLLEEFMINSISYSLCVFTEGAAGTHYTTYYAFTTKDEEQFVLSLTIGEKSCWAHGSPHDPESQFQACEEEYQKAEEGVKELIIQILSTLRFIEEDEVDEDITIEELENTEYYIRVFDKSVKFDDSDYEERVSEGGAQFAITAGIYPDFQDEESKYKIAFGDLNNDEKDDAAVIIFSNTGGSGSWIDLTVILNSNGEPTFIDSAPLGDRTRINSIIIDRGIITLDIVTHGPEDAMCCPTLEKTVKYKLSEGRLVEI